MASPKSQLSLISNLWIKLMTFENAGDVNEGHKHAFDHPTLLVKGRLQVDVDGAVSEFTAPHIIFIASNKPVETPADLAHSRGSGRCRRPLRSTQSLRAGSGSPRTLMLALLFASTSF